MTVPAPTAVTVTPEGAQAKAEELRDALRGEKAPDEAPLDFPHLALDLAVTAAIAAALFLFLIAFKTEIATGGLVLQRRWDDWTFAIVVVVLGRLLFRAVWTRERPGMFGAGVAALLAVGYVALVITESDRRLWLLALAVAAFAGLARRASFAGRVPLGALLLLPAILVVVGYFFAPSLVDGIGSALNALGIPEADVAPLALGLAIVGALLLVPREAGSRSSRTMEAVADRAGTYLAPILVVLAIVWPILFSDNRYILDLSILVLTYVMLGWGLNIVVGLAGLLDLGYVAFYAVGAYSFALLARYLEFGFWTALPVAGLLAALWGIVLGFPVLRLRGDYLAIVTLAFGEIIRVVLINWSEFTGGPNGLLNIPKPTLFGMEFTNSEGGFAQTFGIPYASTQRFVFLYYIILALALLTAFVTIRLKKLPLGRAWEALREDEIACRSLGINTRNTKLTAFALGAMFGGFAGSFFATRQGFISPESFTFIESALILAIVVLGGLGSQIGVVIASVVMIGGFELFRDFAEYRMLIFGIAMVLIMVWRPRGLISSRTPSAILKERKVIGGDLVAQGEGH